MAYASDYTIDELMIAVMSREFKGAVLGGAATYCSTLAAMLAKRVHNPDMVVLDSMNLIDADVIPAYTLQEFIAYRQATKGGGIPLRLSTEELFDFILRGNFLIWVRPAQLDKRGNSNISVIGDWHKPTVQLIGPRGVPEDTAYLDGMYYYLPQHTSRLFVDKVDYVCGVGYGPARDNGEVHWGLPALIVTNLGAFDFDPKQKRMRIKSLHPGVTVETVAENTGFELVVPADIPQTEPPSVEEVEVIRELDPLSCRKLEFLGGKEATELTRRILEKERELLS